MNLTAFFRIEQNTRRLAEVLGVLTRYGLADWFGRLEYGWLQRRLVSGRGEALGKLHRNARIRLALTDLGVTAIKFGQMLSTRADLVGPALASELAQLRSHTPPDAPDIVRATIQAELGKPVEELFASFDDQPLASASIGQVHRARLQTGEAVVVKVQHAGIAEKMTNDLDLMTGLAMLIQNNVEAARAYQPVALLREFRRILLDEMDFACERRNLEQFARHFADDPGVHFPAVYPALCTRRVLTMEQLVGPSAEDAAALAAAGADLAEFARRGAGMYLRMIFRDGFYHADPHPGNLMLLPGGVLGVLDCGMVGRVDARLRRELEGLILGVIHGDADDVTAAVVRLGSVPQDLDQDTLRCELGVFLADYSSRSLQDLDLSRAVNELTDIVHRYHITLPPSCSLLLKTLVMLEGTGRGFSPQFSLAELVRPYGASLVWQRFSPGRIADRVARACRDWDRLAEALPRDLSEILQRLRASSFEIHQRMPRVEAALDRLALAVVCAGLFVAAALLSGRAAPPTLAGVSLPGVGLFLSAGAVSFRLYRSLGQSGK
jgi:ubiquinone biosynthesis protein